MSKPEVIVCCIGDYAALDKRQWATVIFDDKKVAECYTNEDAELIGMALRNLSAMKLVRQKSNAKWKKKLAELYDASKLVSAIEKSLTPKPARKGKKG